MKIVDPRFCVPSRRMFTETYLPRVYDDVISKLKDICSTTFSLSLSFDAWSDRRMRTYYAVTVHFINRVGASKSHLLAFNLLSGQFLFSFYSYLKVFTIRTHTDNNLLTEYERVTTTFDIQTKVIRLITDNASNNLAAFS